MHHTKSHDISLNVGTSPLQNFVNRPLLVLNLTLQFLVGNENNHTDIESYFSPLGHRPCRTSSTTPPGSHSHPHPCCACSDARPSLARPLRPHRPRSCRSCPSCQPCAIWKMYSISMTKHAVIWYHNAVKLPILSAMRKSKEKVWKVVWVVIYQEVKR